MPFPEPKNHRISLAAAAELTKRYRATAPKGAEKGAMFPREDVESVLTQEKCRGLRIYYGRNPEGQMELVLVGVDGEGNDMENGVLIDSNFPCPPVCGDDDDLNS